MEVAELTGKVWDALIGRYSTGEITLLILNPLFSYSVISVGALTVLTYDYIVTLDMEIESVWSEKLSVSSILFFFNRYLPFISVAIASYYILAEQNFDRCRIGVDVFGAFCAAGAMLAELVFLLRTDAIWGHMKSLRVSLIVMFLIQITTLACIYFTAKHLVSVHIPTEMHYSSGCLYTFDQRNWGFLIVFTVCDFFAFMLMLAKRQSDKDLADTALMQVLYQERLSAVNLVMQLTAPPSLLDDFVVPLAILTNIVCSRMLLGVRQGHSKSRRRSSLLLI
ncbi:hypothetical protein ACEPAG_5735 [Sanghuangporus baumii]